MALATPHPSPANRFTGSLFRFLLVVFLWTILAGGQWREPLVIAFILLSVTWLSLRFLPPQKQNPALRPLLAFLPWFAWHSLMGGWDVARRAFHPRLPLDPAMTTFATGDWTDRERHTFIWLVSLLPGTACTGQTNKGLLHIHLLDASAKPALHLLAQKIRQIWRG